MSNFTYSNQPCHAYIWSAFRRRQRESFINHNTLTTMNTVTDFNALRNAYMAPEVEWLPVGSGGCLCTSGNGGEIQPGTIDNWGTF